MQPFSSDPRAQSFLHTSILGLSATLSVLPSNGPFYSPLRNCLAKNLDNFLIPLPFHISQHVLSTVLLKPYPKCIDFSHTSPTTPSVGGHHQKDVDLHWLTCKIDLGDWRLLSLPLVLGIELPPTVSTRGPLQEQSLERVRC